MGNWIMILRKRGNSPVEIKIQRLTIATTICYSNDAVKLYTNISEQIVNFITRIMESLQSFVLCERYAV